jgi:NADH-quinone oxidoreductase subunit G
MPQITVDGKQIPAQPGQMIIQACQDAGIEIPHYCYHPGLSIVASCRICLVEVEGIPKLVPACQTPIRDGMVVFANSTKSVANQKQVMEYLLINHPLDCPVCDQAGECTLQDYSYSYGRSQSRFEEDKHKKPKKDVGDRVMLYNDRCIMCTRCVRFTREVSGQSELYVDGRGHKEEIEIFPGKPLNNALSLNVVDLCPVGALLDKDFLFKQRVWFLKSTPSVSPVDAGGENIYIHWNEGKVYRIKPRYNAEGNKWWISDYTRYSYKVLEAPNRLANATKLAFGAPSVVPFGEALEEADKTLRNVAKENGAGSLYAVLSPMMPCEEAYLLAKYVRSLDPQALLVVGPVPTGEDEVFRHYNTKAETFRIQGEKVPNRRGIERVIGLVGGPSTTWNEFVEFGPVSAGKLKAGWIVGGYLTSWATIKGELPRMLKQGFRVVQDILSSPLTEAADVVLPAAAWAEKAGVWENHQNKLQPFEAAVPPPGDATVEGAVYHKLLNRAGAYSAVSVRGEMGDAFANIAAPKPESEQVAPAVEFAEL